MPKSQHTVVFIGAGSSLANALSYRPAKPLYHPPLDSTFFAKALSLANKERGASASIRRLRRLCKDLGQFDDPFDNVSTSLEQFFADVYYEVSTGRDSQVFDLFVELLHVYVRVLSATTNWMGTHARPGDLDRLLRRELRESEKLTVITFNQDLVIENAAWRLPRLKDTWCLRGLYGDADLSPLYAQGSSLPIFPHHNKDCPHNAPFRLLKLHGSLNWGTRSRTEEPQLGTLFSTDKSRKIFMLDRRIYTDQQRMSSGTPKGRQTWYLWPLIVPPIYDKHRVTGMGLLEGMWTAAKDAVRECDRLVVFGYSLPDADIVASQMLRRAFGANSNLQTVHSIDSDCRIVAKLQSRLNCLAVNYYTHLSAYLRANP